MSRRLRGPGRRRCEPGRARSAWRRKHVFFHTGLYELVTVNIAQHLGGNVGAQPVIHSFAVLKCDDALTIAKGVINLMQRNNNGLPVFPVDARQYLHDVACRNRVERCDRFVRQDDLRPLHKGACDRDALLLPARKRRGPLHGECLHAHTGERFRSLDSFRMSKPPGSPPQGRDSSQSARQDIGEHRQMAHDVELLKDKPHTRPGRPYVPINSIPLACTHLPSTLIELVTQSAAVSPAICRSIVDLPDPDAPISPTICPENMFRLTLSRALWVCRPVLKVLLRLHISIAVQGDVVEEFTGTSLTVFAGTLPSLCYGRIKTTLHLHDIRQS